MTDGQPDLPAAPKKGKATSRARPIVDATIASQAVGSSSTEPTQPLPTMGGPGSTSQTLGSQSTKTSSQAFESGPSYNPEGLSFEPSMEAKLDRFVEDFKKGRLTKVRAIGLIAQTLPLLDGDDSTSANAALESFIAILNGHENALGQSIT